MKDFVGIRQGLSPIIIAPFKDRHASRIIQK